MAVMMSGKERSDVIRPFVRSAVFCGKIALLVGHSPLIYCTLVVAYLGWVDLDLGCSTVLTNYTASFAKFPSAQAEQGRQWNDQIHSQPKKWVLTNRTYSYLKLVDKRFLKFTSFCFTYQLPNLGITKIRKKWVLCDGKIGYVASPTIDRIFIFLIEGSKPIKRSDHPTIN